MKVRLRELREEAGISQQELAELFSVAKRKQTSQSKISRIETGFVRLAIEDAMIFARVLNELGVRNRDGDTLTFDDLYESEGKFRCLIN